MDTTRRIFAKSVTWQAMGFISMTLAGLFFTGSVSASAGIALTGAIMGMIGYIAHEFVWSRVTWGRRLALANPLPTPSTRNPSPDRN